MEYWWNNNSTHQSSIILPMKSWCPRGMHPVERCQRCGVIRCWISYIVRGKVYVWSVWLFVNTRSTIAALAMITRAVYWRMIESWWRVYLRPWTTFASSMVITHSITTSSSTTMMLKQRTEKEIVITILNPSFIEKARGRTVLFIPDYTECYHSQLYALLALNQSTNVHWKWTGLIHFSPMFHFYTTRKRQKTSGFLMFSGAIKREHWTKMGKQLIIQYLFWKQLELSQNKNGILPASQKENQHLAILSSYRNEIQNERKIPCDSSVKWIQFSILLVN